MEECPDSLHQELEALRQENSRLAARAAEQQRAIETLRKQEGMYRQAIEAADGVVYLFDFQQNCYTYMGERIERLIGYTVEETTPELWSRIGSLLHWRGELQGLTIAEAVRRYRSGEVAIWSADYVCRTKQDEIRWLSDTSVSLRDEAGRIYGCLGILQDITERKWWDEALRGSEQRYRDLLDTMQLIAVLLDTEGQITYANDYLLTLTGYQLGEVIGRNWFDLFLPSEEREVVRESFHAHLARGYVTPQDENSIRAVDGERRLVSWNNTLLRDGSGAIVGTASIGVDITERKRLEEQLLQAMKLESIGRLAGGIAHDFNNILTAIIGYSELAREELLPDSAALPFLENIQTAGERAADLTAQLLAFARRQIITPQVLHLNALITETEKILRRLLGEHIELHLLLSSELGRIRADSNQIQQVLLNLAVNARDAMPEGGLLTIETDNVMIDADYARSHREVRPGEYVMLAVSDTGIGMEEAVQRHIFEPFYTTKEVGKGTGLGLATCHGIVKQNGGHIWLYSEPGRGATFKVYLPRVGDSVTAPPPGEASPQTPRGTETILVVEDEPLVREFVARALRALGYHVLIAEDGVEALEVAAMFPARIHLLLTDIVMPRMGGPLLADRIRAVCPDIKVIFATGHTENTVVLHGVLKASVVCLQKPYQIRILARKVREVLEDTGKNAD